jgi:hypothetical protein
MLRISLTELLILQCSGPSLNPVKMPCSILSIQKCFLCFHQLTRYMIRWLAGESAAFHQLTGCKFSLCAGESSALATRALIWILYSSYSLFIALRSSTNEGCIFCKMAPTSLQILKFLKGFQKSTLLLHHQKNSMKLYQQDNPRQG